MLMIHVDHMTTLHGEFVELVIGLNREEVEWSFRTGQNINPH